ncbi:MAG TPA: universal stress protein [Ktedonobacteraceae bacterium]|nr:universal stress protein [Ktedonobacteraceae bacterium]
MFERILVPLDGSARAEQALPVAARLARASGGSLLLLRVAIVPIIERPDLTPSREYNQQAIDEGLREAITYLEQVVTRTELVGMTVEVESLFGAIAPTILSVAQSSHADLIVMSSHGYTGLKRWALGSIAQKVARHSPVPVLVLREGGTLPTQVQGAVVPLSVLVPLDGSELAEAAIEPAAQLAATLAAAGQSQLHLLYVVAIPSTSGKYRSQTHIDFDADIRAQAKEEAEAYLHTLVTRSPVTELAAHMIAVTPEVVINNDVAQAIIQAAEHDAQVEGGVASGESGIIAMATHGRGGIGRWALGSQTERVLGACKVPLLIVRPHHVKAKYAPNSGEAAQGEAAEGEETIIVQETWIES